MVSAAANLAELKDKKQEAVEVLELRPVGCEKQASDMEREDGAEEAQRREEGMGH